MAYLTTTALVRAAGNLPGSGVLADAQITPHISAAARRLKRWMGAEAYADALLDIPTDADRAAAMTDAETLLTISYGLSSWNQRITEAGSMASGQLGESSFTLRTPAEIETEKKMWLERAEEALADYLSDPAPTAHKVIADDEID